MCLEDPKKVSKMSQNLSSKGYRKTKRVIEKVFQEWGIKALKEPSRVRYSLTVFQPDLQKRPDWKNDEFLFYSLILKAYILWKLYSLLVYVAFKYAIIKHLMH